MMYETIPAVDDGKLHGGSQLMFVNDLENYITCDTERDITLRGAGSIKDEAGEFFVLFWRDIKIPFQAEAKFTQLPSREWWWIDWVILSLGRGPNATLPNEPAPRFRTTFHHDFFSVEEEWEAVGIIKEALTAYGDCFGTTKGDVRQVVIAEEAWTFPENRVRATATKDADGEQG